MIEEENFETYLSVTKDKFVIFLFDKKNLKNLYKDELEIKDKDQDKEHIIDLKNLSTFLDNNIFKIEKLVGTFIKNICLIIETDKDLYVNMCVKKKNL